jgi:hypothetical protein
MSTRLARFGVAITDLRQIAHREIYFKSVTAKTRVANRNGSISGNSSRQRLQIPLNTRREPAISRP